MRLSAYSQKSADAPTGLTGNPARDLARSFNVRVIIFLSLHVPLAMAMELSPWVATIHAAIATLYGLRAALVGRPSQVVYAVAYIGAAEVLWRMSQAFLFWEYAKYALILVVFVAIVVELRQGDEGRRLRHVSPLLLLLALVPGAVSAILELGLGGARDTLSFNLSAYAATGMLALYLWARPINRDTTVRLLLAIMAPVVAITFLAVYFTLTDLDSLDFVGASNWVTSGNYGPNQVANMMGFGALAGVMLFTLLPRSRGARGFVLLMTLAMLGQGLLTFSRGGIYSFVLALAVFGLHLMNTPRARGRLLIIFGLFGIILIAGIYPLLDDFTGGSLSERFRDTDTTGRLEAAEVDLRAFTENIFIGVGVGQSNEYHLNYLGHSLAAHTEYTRLLAEHGLFGVLALLILIWMLAKRYAANAPGFGRAMSAALAVWAASIMLHSAMRLAAIPVALALALVLWRLRGRAEAEEREPARVESPLIDFGVR
jgi:hypothetical protein